MNHEELFSYDRFQVGEDMQSVDFSYSLKHAGETFQLTEKLRFPTPIPEIYETQAALKGLHLALGISYYKLFVPPEIQHPYAMNDSEATFWNDVWKNGLGEFMYTNQLHTDELARFSTQNGEKPSKLPLTEWQDTALLGIGGGKDSIVAGELLKAAGVSIEGFVMATGAQLGQTMQVAQKMGIQLQPVERTIDPQLLTLNDRPDAYNGHVPISLIFALVGTLAAVSSSYKYVVVANESSSSIPRIQNDNVSVNHQWSKSLTFEQMFQDYVHKNISRELDYFSAVRPLNSIALVKLFAEYPDYLNVFTSDNSVFKIDPEKRPTDRWSLNSPKSLSSFILLAPWIDADRLLKAFGADFLNEASLEELFLSLIGVKGEQPLDCVGTVDELRSSLMQIVQSGNYDNSYLVQVVKNSGVLDADVLPISGYLSLETDDLIPDELKEKLRMQMETGIKK